MSMIFPINAKRNTENARNYWTTTRRESRRGYDIEYLCEHKTNGAQSRIILSVYNGKHPFYIAELETPESRLVFKLSEYRNIDEPHGSTICIDNVDIYAKGSNYKRRTERSMRYLQKYGSMACLVHGLIAAGLVESAEAPTEPETNEGNEDTTTTKTEPQEGTETAQKTTDRTTDMETFKKAYSAAYSHLYDHAHTPAAKAKTRIYSALFDEQWKQIKDIAKAFCKITGDLLTSDREAAAFMIALETVGTPTAGDTEPQRATETAQKAAGDTAPIEGTQEGAQTAGTSEGAQTTTTPHTEPPRAAERAAGSVSQSDRRTRPAAPQSHESGEGIQRHHRPPKTAYRAIQRAATIPARYHHAQTTTSRGSPKICISWG